MRKSTLPALFFSGITLLALVCAPQLIWAQHGGGGHGGGGGGGFHGGGGGGFHGGGAHGGGFGGYHGGFSGGYHGGFSRGGFSGGYRGNMSGGMRGGESAIRGSAGPSHPWSWEGHSASRDTSPGWHGFSGVGGHNDATPSRSAPGSSPGRSGAANMASH